MLRMLNKLKKMPRNRKKLSEYKILRKKPASAFDITNKIRAFAAREQDQLWSLFVRYREPMSITAVSKATRAWKSSSPSQDWKVRGEWDQSEARAVCWLYFVARTDVKNIGAKIRAGIESGKLRLSNLYYSTNLHLPSLPDSWYFFSVV